MIRTTLCAILATVGTLDAAAAQWTALRNNDAVTLSVDQSSVARRGDQVRLKYLIDYRTPQSNPLYQIRYRSVVQAATLRCKPRTVSLGASEIYSAPGATGVLLATTAPNNRESAYGPIEKGTSDEDLWRHVCEKKASPGKP